DRTARGGNGARRHVAGNDRVRHAGEAAMPEMDVGAADLRESRLEQDGSGRQIGAREFADLDPLPRSGHHRGKNAVAHAVYVILERMLIQTLSAVWVVAALA